MENLELCLQVSPLSLVLLALYAAYVYLTTRGSRSPRLPLPPSPPGWPVIGHLHLLSGGMPHRAMAELARTMRAPLLQLRLGSVPAVVISKPDLARAALASSLPHLLFSGQFLSFGYSHVTFAPAEAYRRAARRVLLVAELLSAGRVPTHGAVRVKELRRLLAHLDLRNSWSTPENMSEYFSNLSNDVLCRVAFGRLFLRAGEEEGDEEAGNRVAFGRRFPHGEGDKLGAVLAEAQELFAGFAVGDYFPALEPLASAVTGRRRRLKRCLAGLREVCDEIVDEHLKLGGGDGRDDDEDVVDVLLRDLDQEVPLTEDNLKALVLDMFVAGTDTSFVTLEWAMTELVRHPRVLAKAQAEVRRVLGARVYAVKESHLGELHYIRAIVKETFRLHPAVPLLLPGESVLPCVLGGYYIPAGTRVFINTFAMGRDPEVWGDDVLDFSPERFEIADGGDIDLRGCTDYKLLLFGDGCTVGYTAALATVQMALASFLFHYDWALPDGMTAEDVSLEETFGLATRKKEPLRVVLTNVRPNMSFEDEFVEVYDEKQAREKALNKV